MSHPSQNWKKHLQENLESRGLRFTQQRQLICEVFFGQDGHANVEDLYDQVRQRNEKVGYATVYRTLKLLTEFGLASSMRFGDGTTRFEPTAHHHDHLICTECGAIFEFENEEIEQLQEQVAKSHKFQLSHHKMELYGTCEEFSRTGKACS